MRVRTPRLVTAVAEATVTALRTPERTGTYDVFAFKRSAAGAWSHTSFPLTRNKE